MTTAPERDWTPWLPPSDTPDVGVRDMKAGQVWAERWNDFATVFRVGAPASPPGYVDAICMAKLGPTWKGGSIHPASPVGKRAVLVQDVGQPEPTPPEVLYGPKAPPRFEYLPGDIIGLKDGSQWMLRNRVSKDDIHGVECWKIKPLTTAHEYVDQLIFNHCEVFSVQRDEWQIGQRRRIHADGKAIEGTLMRREPLPRDAGFFWVVDVGDELKYTAVLEGLPSELLNPDIPADYRERLQSLDAEKRGNLLNGTWSGELLPGDVITLGKPWAGASVWRLVERFNPILWRGEPYDPKAGVFCHEMELHFTPADVTKVVPGWRAGQRRRGPVCCRPEDPPGASNPICPGGDMVTYRLTSKREDGSWDTDTPNRFRINERWPSDLLEEAPAEQPGSTAGWRLGQRRRFWNSAGAHRDAVLVSYGGSPGMPGGGLWCVVRTDDGNEYRLVTTIRSELLSEAPPAIREGDMVAMKDDGTLVPAGQTTEGRIHAELRRSVPGENAAAVLKRYTDAMDADDNRALADYYRKVAGPVVSQETHAAIDRFRSLADAAAKAPADDVICAKCGAPRNILPGGAGGTSRDDFGKAYCVAHRTLWGTPPLREVSSNGREWVRYDSDNPYPFEDFKRRRLDGVDVGYVDPAPVRCERVVAVLGPLRHLSGPCGWPALARVGMNGPEKLCEYHMADMEEHLVRLGHNEASVARMAEMDRLATAPPPVEPACQPTLFGGIWRPW